MYIVSSYFVVCIHIFYDYILTIRVDSVIGQHPQITDMFFIKPYLKCTVKHLRTSDSSGIMCSINNIACIGNSYSKRVNLFLYSNTVNQKEMLIENLDQLIIGHVNDTLLSVCSILSLCIRLMKFNIET